MDKQELVTRIYDRVSSEIDDITEEDVREHVDKFASYESLPEEEVERTVERHIAKEYDMSREEFNQQSSSSSEDNLHTVGEVNDMGEGEWVSLEVQFDEAWDADDHEDMVQQGLLGDETGRIKFTSWSGGNPPELEEGESYRINNVVTSTYKGRTNVTFRSNTEVEELDEDVEVNSGGEETEVVGAFVNMRSNSGLIKRCPEDDCTRVIQKGRCKEHGEKDGEFDLRIKGVVDDGETAHNIILNKEKTIELTGMSLDEAKEIAMDELDSDAVADRMEADLIGKYYRLTGSEPGQDILVEEIEEYTELPDIENIRINARSMQS
jgi:ssDNA-binding replication factor A large subunit